MDKSEIYKKRSITFLTLAIAAIALNAFLAQVTTITLPPPSYRFVAYVLVFIASYLYIVSVKRSKWWLLLGLLDFIGYIVLRIFVKRKD